MNPLYTKTTTTTVSSSTTAKENSLLLSSSYQHEQHEHIIKKKNPKSSSSSVTFQSIGSGIVRFLLIWSLPFVLVFWLIGFQILPSTPLTSSTATATWDGSESQPASSSSSATFHSAFPDDLYHYHTNNSNNNDDDAPCQPQKIHLSQATNIFYSDNNHNDNNDENDTSSSMSSPSSQPPFSFPLVNLTVSFTVSSKHYECELAQPVLIYGRKKTEQQEQEQKIEGKVFHSEKVQFQYTTLDQEDYTSDWIHHMVIPNLHAGRIEYWYRLYMITASTTTSSSSTTTSTSTPNSNNNDNNNAADADISAGNNNNMSNSSKTITTLLSNNPSKSSSSSSTTLHRRSLSSLEELWNTNNNHNDNYNKNDDNSNQGQEHSNLRRQATSTATLNNNPIITNTNTNTMDTIFVLGETNTSYTFVTTPIPHQPTSLALVGDLGQTENSTKTMNHIYQLTHLGTISKNENNNNNANDDKDVSIDLGPPVSALLIAGDMSYADGDPHRWESWFDLMEPLLRSTPIQVAAGNHEIECDNRTSQVFIPYESYFRNPNRLGPPQRLPVPDDYRKEHLWNQECITSSQFLGHYDYGNSFYSFQHGLAHVIVLNSYTDTLPGSIQYQWLDEELSNNVNRQTTPWLIVMFHCPLHTTFIGHNGEINPFLMLKSMEPLFVQYKVNLILSGHDHAYMRTTPMIGTEKATRTTRNKHNDNSDNIINDDDSTIPDDNDDGPQIAPIYLTLGAGGNRELHSKGYIHDVPEDWVVKRDNSEYGFGHLYLANSTHAKFHWVRDGTTKDGIQDLVWIENYV